MFTLISQTFIIVLLLTFSFGPAFFALVNTGIKHGYKTGAVLATGIILSDFFVCLLNILLIDLGATNFIHDEKTQRFMGILAGVVLIIFGSFYFKRPITNAETNTIEFKKPSTWLMLLKGFFLNSFNPTVWLLWLGNVTAISKTLEYSVIKMIIYFSITLGIVLLIELSKAYAANKLKKILTPQLMHRINVLTGVLLIIFGFGLVYNHYF